MTDFDALARQYDAENLRAFLKANATVVAPGETLVIRAPDLTPNQIREVMEWLNYADEDGPYLPFRTVVVPGDGFAVAPDLLTQVAEGKMSVNAARKALGLPTWPVPECDEAREVP